MDDTLTVTFAKPVEHASVAYAKLELREPTAGDLAQTDGLEGYTSDVRLVSVVAAVPEPAVRLIPAREFLQATRFLGGFLKPAPPTGAAA